MTVDTYAHDDEVPGSVRAAERLVPLILETLGQIRSVVDLGGGTGAWLRKFRACGVETVLLIDCPEVESHLLIERSSFSPADLNKKFPNMTSRFDLAVCVECAEHLLPDRAPSLIEWLSSVSDRVVFSAAIPGQGGKGHVNEQLPSYWTSLFSRYGFVRRDVLRRDIINDTTVPPWYRQNILLFTKPDVVLNSKDTDFITEEFVLVNEALLRNRGLKDLLRQLWPTFVSAIRRRLGRNTVTQAAAPRRKGN